MQSEALTAPSYTGLPVPLGAAASPSHWDSDWPHGLQPILDRSSVGTSIPPCHEFSDASAQNAHRTPSRLRMGGAADTSRFVVVQSLSHVWLCDPHGPQHTRLPCPLLSPGVCSNSCPLSRWCHPTISSSVIPFSSCPQSSPASGSFPMSWLLTSGGQNIRASAF